jgi:hypothetical protein
VLEAVFILLEFRSPSRRIFIGSHSLPPPSLVRRIGPSRGYKLVGRGCRAQVPGDGVRSYEGLTLVTIALLSFIVTRGGAQEEVKKSYSDRQLARPIVRRCLSGYIEAKSRCLVGGAAAWPGWTVHSGTLGLLPE